MLPEPTEQIHDEDEYYVDDAALLDIAEQLEGNKRKWNMDDNIVGYPAFKHRERI